MDNYTEIDYTIFVKMDTNEVTYGFTICNQFDYKGCKNDYSSAEQLKEEVNKYNVLDIVHVYFIDIYDSIMDEGGFILNGELVKVNENGEVIEDSEDETLLPDNSTLPDGEPKFVLNVTDEEAEEISKEIKEAAEDLII